MSYILEALRKSERARLLGQTPALPALVADQPPVRQRWLPRLIALLLSVNGIILGLLWLSGWGKTPASVEPVVTDQHPKSAENAAAVVPPQSPNAATAQTPDLAPKPVLQETQPGKSDPHPFTSAGNQAQQERPGEKTGDPPIRSARPDSTSAIKPTVAKKPARLVAPTPPGKSREATIDQDPDPANGVLRASPQRNLSREDHSAFEAEASRLAMARTPVVEDSGVADHDGGPPLLSAMPLAFQQRLPSMKINVLAYSPLPEERFAVIDMVKYSKGERLPGGALLVEIKSDSVVLELDGSRFRVSHR